MLRLNCCSLACLAVVSLTAPIASAQPAKVEFNRDVRPILSEHCLLCHGPDNSQRKAKLRLDVEKDALAKVLVPGKPGESELFKRITAADPDEVMPPPKHKKPLSKDQIGV